MTECSTSLLTPDAIFYKLEATYLVGFKGDSAKQGPYS